MKRPFIGLYPALVTRVTGLDQWGVGGTVRAAAPACRGARRGAPGGVWKGRAHARRDRQAHARGGVLLVEVRRDQGRRDQGGVRRAARGLPLPVEPADRRPRRRGPRAGAGAEAAPTARTPAGRPLGPSPGRLTSPTRNE